MGTRFLIYCLSVGCAVLAITTEKKKPTVVCLAGCAVVSVFGSGDYDRTKKKLQSSVWRVVLVCQFSVLAGNWQFFCCGGKVLLRPEKKVPVICLAGCAVVSVFGSGDYDRKKKVLVVCLAGCAGVSVFGSGNYDRKKISSSRLSGGL